MRNDVLLALVHHGAARYLLPVYVLPSMSTESTFLCGQLTVARAWNRRAYRIVRRTEWVIGGEAHRSIRSTLACERYRISSVRARRGRPSGRRMDDAADRAQHGTEDHFIHVLLGEDEPLARLG